MSIISKINEYNDSKDKFSYTILVHSTINQELIDTIKKKLDNINKKWIEISKIDKNIKEIADYISS